MSNQGKKLWYIRVKGLSEMPAKRAHAILRDVKDRVREWVKAGEWPLILPDNIEIGTLTDQWEHSFVPWDGTRGALIDAIHEMQEDGWQFAAEAGGYLVFKRPAAPELDADTLKVTQA